MELLHVGLAYSVGTPMKTKQKRTMNRNNDRWLSAGTPEGHLVIHIFFNNEPYVMMHDFLQISITLVNITMANTVSLASSGLN